MDGQDRSFVAIAQELVHRVCGARFMVRSGGYEHGSGWSVSVYQRSMQWKIKLASRTRTFVPVQRPSPTPNLQFPPHICLQFICEFVSSVRSAKIHRVRKKMLGGYAAFNQLQTDATFLSPSVADTPLLFSLSHWSKWLGYAFCKLIVAVVGSVMLVDLIPNGTRPGIKQ